MKNTYSILERNRIAEEHLWCIDSVMRKNHALIRAARLDYEEVYESGRLKWHTTNGSQEFKNKIPKRCPIDISVAMTSTYTNGVWDDLFEGSVHQEVFRPYKDKALILLSGIMIDSADWYNS